MDHYVFMVLATKEGEVKAQAFIDELYRAQLAARLRDLLGNRADDGRLAISIKPELAEEIIEVLERPAPERKSRVF